MPIPFLYANESNAAFGLDLRSGVMAAGLAGDSEIFHFRWTAATLALVHEVRMWAGNEVTAAFAANWFSFRLFFARAWTADGTGGATATLTGNNHKLRTSFDTTTLGTARVATTAALGAGTKSLDAQALASVGGSTPATAGANLLAPTSIFRSSERETPIVLAQNEGLSIVASVPATGTWLFGVSVRWEEARRL